MTECGKKIIDIASALFLIIFIACPRWLYVGPLLIITNLPVKLPLQIVVFGADGFPFMFGLFWLSRRYAGEMSFFIRWKIQHLVAIGIVLPLFLLKFHLR